MHEPLIEAARHKAAGSVRKYEKYFADYDFNFHHLRDKKLKILEIGVQGGGSLHMWKRYFPGAQIVGIDIDPSCKEYEGDAVKIYIGSQEDAQFLQQIARDEGPFDIIIDDGGHTMRQQLVTFHTLFPHLREGGVFVIEDIHTSYWFEFGGRKGKRNTAVGLLKNLIDEMHYWAIGRRRASRWLYLKSKLFGPLPQPMPKNEYQKEVRAVYVAGSIAFIHKGQTDPHTVIKF